MKCSQASATITRWAKGERGQPVANMILQAEQHARNCGCPTCTRSQQRLDRQTVSTDAVTV